VHLLEAQDCTRKGWLAGLKAATEHLVERIEENVLTLALPVGHGAALHYPDQPWAHWHYIDGENNFVSRHNLPEFVQAAGMACREDFEAQPGMPENVKDALAQLLDINRDPDENQRLLSFCERVQVGGIPGLKEPIPDYVAKGPGSWKCNATGLQHDDDTGDRPIWSDTFERSDYRLFHDAVKQHRFVTTQEILPAHGLRIA
jgi:hypothetical protein